MGAIQNKLEGPVTDELTLVQAAKKGDDSAFEELVRRYDRNVFRIAQHITQNREDAEDVVQEAFLKAYSNLAKFQEQSKFYTWLVRIAVNEALMKLRRKKPERTVGVLNELPHFVLLLVPFHHAWENRILSRHPDRDADSAPILTADYTVLVAMSGITSGRVRLRSDFLCDFIPNAGAAQGESDWANTTVTK